MRITTKIALAMPLALGLAACGHENPTSTDAGTDVIGETPAPTGGVPVTVPTEPVETVAVPNDAITSPTPSSTAPTMAGSQRATPTNKAPDPMTTPDEPGGR